MRKRSEATMGLSRFDFGWLIGIIEADGTFTGKDTRIVIKMTDRDTIVRAARLLNTNVNGPYVNNSNDGCIRKDAYVCFVSGKRARSIMKLLRPFMSLRRQNQIDILLGSQWELFEYPRDLLAIREIAA